MKRSFFKTLLSLASFTVALSGVQASSHMTAKEQRKYILAFLDQRELFDIGEDQKVTSRDIGIVQTMSPIAADTGSALHYQKTLYTFKNVEVSFIAFYTYLDEEDGGNSYGWVVDSRGAVIARIADSGFYPVRKAELVPSKTVTLMYTAFGEENTVGKEEMESEDTSVSLDEIFNPFGRATPTALCFKGDINQVCSLLSLMSKFSEVKYSNGDHGLAQLKGCRVLGRGKPVEARVELSDDYSSEVTKVTQIIEACN